MVPSKPCCGGAGAGGGGNESVGLQRGQGRPHNPWEIWDALRALKSRKLLLDTAPLKLNIRAT